MSHAYTDSANLAISGSRQTNNFQPGGRQVVAHGASRGDLVAGSISPEGDTSQDVDQVIEVVSPSGLKQHLHNSTHG